MKREGHGGNQHCMSVNKKEKHLKPSPSPVHLNQFTIGVALHAQPLSVLPEQESGNPNRQARQQRPEFPRAREHPALLGGSEFQGEHIVLDLLQSRLDVFYLHRDPHKKVSVGELV